MANQILREYANFSGVDFTSEPRIVAINRSPDACNVYKSYSQTLGNCIQTRPGYKKIHQFDGKILGMFFYTENKVLVHSENKLYEIAEFPTGDATVLYKQMNTKERSTFVLLNQKVYIIDGENYLVYDGTTVKDATEDAYIPTTTISRAPSGGGELYQDINLLSKFRKNQFLADGTSTNYYLDATQIDVDTVKITVNDQQLTEGTGFTVDRTLGKVTFNTAPAKPSFAGKDNVIVTFAKTVSGYADRIKKCTKAVLFDNRIFFTGNNLFQNALFHCALDNPLYIEDLAYYEDGSSNSPITGISVGNNILWVFKNLDQQNANIFYHVPSFSNEYDRIYPSKQGNVSIGCYADSYNFNDDIVYLSQNGLEGIATSQETNQMTFHRSSLIDSKLLESTNYKEAMMCKWNNYLLILVANQIFLADGNQKFSSFNNNYEYEWFYWLFEHIEPCFIKEYKNKLYIGDTSGNLYNLEGSNDNGEIIRSWWTTPSDSFESPNHLKTTNKRGGVAKVKTIPNGKIKIGCLTDRKGIERLITSKSLNGFKFKDLSFDNFSFVSTDKSYLVYKIKEKKFNELQLRFYSDELDKPFGIFSAVIEVFIGGYVKR